MFARLMHGGDSRLLLFLNALWPRAVGKAIAQHSRPVSFVTGTLTLATACPSWAAQLGQMNEELRAGINSFLGRRVVKKLRVRHAPNLILETGNSKLDTGKYELEAKDSKLETRNWKLEISGRCPESEGGDRVPVRERPAPQSRLRAPGRSKPQPR